jgi:molybdopterin converting factor small subunit
MPLLHGMKITLLAFAQARELLGFSEQVISLKPGATPASLLEELYPGAKETLSSSRVAVDLEYADWSQPLRDGQILAIIPPVNGG